MYSVKGGVGKTTLAANLAFCAAQDGHRTLLWDLDAAGGAGFVCGIGHAADRTGSRGSTRGAASVFSRTVAPDKLIRRTLWELLDILPADETIRALDSQLLKLGKRRRIAKLAASLAESYDVIVLDCPPVLNELSAQVMRAADAVIVPLPPSPLAARALDLVQREIAAHARERLPILPVHSMLDMRRVLHRDAVAAAPHWPAVPYASAVEQCAVRRLPVGAFAPACPTAKAFEALWRVVVARLRQGLDAAT